MATVLPLRYILLAVAVMAVWGSNFVVARYALDHLPPLLFAALRFRSEERRVGKECRL